MTEPQEAGLGSARAKRRKRQKQTLHVPIWYYVLLGVIAVGGIVGIVLSNIGAPPRPMDARDMVGPNDHALGSMNAPVTIIDWGSFT